MTSMFAGTVLTGILLLTQTIRGNDTDTKYGMVLGLISSLSPSSMTKEVLVSAPCDAVNPTIISYIDCKHLRDGAYQDPNTRNCSEYFRCEKQQRINCSCGPELIFDTEFQTCTSGRQQAPCPKSVCFNQADGFYHVANSSCRKYYECRGGRRSYHECSKGLAFDIEKSVCVDEGEARCSGDAPQSDAPAVTDCNGRSDGKYGIRGSHDKRFYECLGGLKIQEGACLEGQTFSEELQRCVTVPAPLAVMAAATPPPPLPSRNDPGKTPSTVFEGNDCKELPDGYYPNVHYDCRRFFFCREKRKLLEMACPEGMQFDDQTKQCLDSSEVTCPGGGQTEEDEQENVDCKNKTDGYYPLEWSECRQFFYCKNGQKTSDLYCPAGEAFDISTKRCENGKAVVCGGRPLSMVDARDSDNPDLCVGKRDDYYPDYATDCHRFVYCKSGRKQIELTCRRNKAFDPVSKSCQPASSVACKKAESVSARCSGKPDGYHPDIAKNCRAFYFCRGGLVEVQLTCSAGQAFDSDAKECLPHRMVSCMSSVPPAGADQMASKMSSTLRPHSVQSSETLCKNQADDFYPDYSKGCVEYVHCRQGKKASEFVCTPGQLFDYITKQCVNARYVACLDPRSRYHLDSCAFKDDGYYPAYTKNCRTYYYCRNRMKIVDLNCREGQIFDRGHGECKDDTVAACDIEGLQNLSVECRARSDGYYSDYDSGDGNCSIYFYCRQGMKAGDFACADGMCFDENDGLCVASSSAGFNCSDLPDGYYVDHQASCRKFHICQNGKLETEKCPGNMIFDLSDLSCETRKTLQCKAWREFPCRSRPDGAHADQRGHDQLFHVCRGGRHVESGSCPHFFTFDKTVTKCVSVRTSEMTPLAVADDPGAAFAPDCRSRSDGYYADVASECSRYYECRDGRPVRTASCPLGLLFQSWKQECRPRDEVTCADDAAPTPASTTGTSSFHFQFRNGCNNVTLCFENKHSFAKHCAPHGDQDRSYCKIGSIAETKSSDHDGSSQLPDPLSEFDCDGKEDGYYTDPPSDCRKWHMCEGGRGYTYECESGKAFDILHKRCDLSDTVSCDAQSWVYRNYSSARSLPTSFRSQTQEFRKQTAAVGDHQQCARKSDGIYIDLTGVSFPSNTCFNVYLCINKQVYSISCPFEKPRQGDKEVMCQAKDDVKCMKGAVVGGGHQLTQTAVASAEHDVVEAQPTSLVSRRLLTPLNATAIEPSASATAFNCSGKADGFYPDHYQQCHVFYRCVRGKKFSHYCQPGQLFNSRLQGCDFEENVDCEQQTFVSAKPHK